MPQQLATLASSSLNSRENTTCETVRFHPQLRDIYSSINSTIKSRISNPILQAVVQCILGSLGMIPNRRCNQHESGDPKNCSMIAMKDVFDCNLSEWRHVIGRHRRLNRPKSPDMTPMTQSTRVRSACVFAI